MVLKVWEQRDGFVWEYRGVTGEVSMIGNLVISSVTAGGGKPVSMTVNLPVTPPPPGPSAWAPDATADQIAVQALYSSLSLDDLLTFTTGTDADGITASDQDGASVSNGDPVEWWPDHRDVDRALTAKNDTLRAKYNGTDDAVEFDAPSGVPGRSLFFPVELSSPVFYLSMAVRSTLDNTDDKCIVTTPRWQVQDVVAGVKGIFIRTSGEWWPIITGYVSDWRLIEVRSDGTFLDYRTNGEAWTRVTPATWLSNTTASPGGVPDPRVSQIGRGRFDDGDTFLHWEGQINGLVVTQGGSLPSDTGAAPIRRLVCRDLGLTGLDPAATTPVANADTAATPYETPVEINVLANDTAPGSSIDTTSVTITAQGAKGTAVPDGVTGVVTYTPDLTETGTDQFQYTFDNAAATTSNAATVTVEIGESGGGTPPSGEPGQSEATTVSVTTYSGLASAVAAASAGTVIELANGTYSGSQITVSASGTAVNPIIIRAANTLGANVPGGFRVTGSYVIIRGIDFNEDATGTDRCTLGGTSSQYWRCRFRYNGGQNNLRLLDGTGGRVMFCEFTVVDPNDDFAPSSRSLGGWINGSNPHYNAEIGYCYFHDLLSKPEGEPYGTRARSGLGLNNANNNSGLVSNWWIHHCLFVDCGNSRLNVKMSGNLIEYCTITGRNGGSATYSCDFNQRFGEDNTWRGCWGENMDGIRVMGNRNKYISCKLVTSTPMDVSMGDHDAPPWLSTYPRANDTKLTACDLTVRVGGMTWAGPLPARNTRIENHTGTVSLINQTGTVQTSTMTEAPVTPIKMLVSQVGPSGTGL